MIKKLDMTNPETAREVLAVQFPSYKVEAEIIGFSDLPPLRDTVQTLQERGEVFFGRFVNGELAGVISIKKDDGILDIHRLIVHPKYFKRGIAGTLLHFIESEIGSYEAIIVSTASNNTPAVTFYLKNGFTKTGERTAAEGLLLTDFKKAEYAEGLKNRYR